MNWPQVDYWLTPLVGPPPTQRADARAAARDLVHALVGDLDQGRAVEEVGAERHRPADGGDPSLDPLVDAVHLACAEIEEDGLVSIATWNTLADAVGPGHLLVVVASSRE